MRVQPENGMDKHLNESAGIMLRLFDGYEKRHIEMGGELAANDKGKVNGKTQTVSGPLTTQLVARHIAGEKPVGVAPVRVDSTCTWGVLDVDCYDMPEDDVFALRERIHARSAAFRTKSRGLHIVVFVDEPVPAKLMHQYLVALRKRLPKKVQQKTEVFPKETQTVVAPDNEPTAVWLPVNGQKREFAWLIDHESMKGALDEISTSMLLDHIDKHCRTPTQIVTDIVNATPALDTSEIGYKVPDNPAGRNDLLMRVAMSMQARGWPDTEMDAEIRRLNGDTGFHELFVDGALPEAEIVNLLRSAKRREKGTPTPLHYRLVEKFNREWAVMRVNGQVEFLNREEGECYAKNAFLDATAPQMVMMGKHRTPISKLWLHDIDRAEYRGIVIEPPDYNGPGFNVFKGWACQPQNGNSTLWEEYIQDVLCSGDAALAQWVMTYLADGVQRPWSHHPGSALALRGGQGAGKSFLGRAIRKLIGPAHAQQIAESDRMFARFNRGLFGSTFVLCEESLFAGSSRQAAIAKSFITSDTWSYEQKYLAQFDGKNVHRIIATTNDDQAVHIDHDDRRWTVIEVPTRFDSHSKEAIAWWEPYYRLIDDNPGVVLDYLLQFEVDHDLIRYGHVTEAKSRDKVASDPLLALMDEIAETGVLPDDLSGAGKVSTATLARECYARGASRKDHPRKFSNQMRDKFGAQTAGRNCTWIETVHRGTDSNGILTVTPVYSTDRPGVVLPPLREFRRLVAHKTGNTYPEDGEWRVYQPPNPGYDTDPNGGDPDAVEKYLTQRWVRDETPF